MRGYAARALGFMNAKEYVKQVAELLKEKEVWVRSCAAEALGRMKAKEYAKQVVELLNDKYKHVRGNSACALGRLVTAEEAKANGYAKAVTQLLGDEAECAVYDESKDDYMETTVCAVAADVLKG